MAAPDGPPDGPPPWAVAPGSTEDAVSRSSGARGAIRPTRPTSGRGSGGRGAPSDGQVAGSGAPRPADEDAHRDDPEIETLDTAQLLTQRLGAQVIEEIPHG